VNQMGVEIDVGPRETKCFSASQPKCQSREVLRLVHRDSRNKFGRCALAVEGEVCSDGD
jgi:hypothetical protein